ncbi:hypothetical protein EJA72_27850, partial [Pseudomonas sp. PB120]|nr:hypothetical protein [Pseudomonas sp. PB120]
CQSTSMWLTHHREQARSYRGFAVFFAIGFTRPGCGTIPATFSHTRIDNAHDRPPHTTPRAQEA